MSPGRFGFVLLALLLSACAHIPARHVLEDGDLEVQITAYRADTEQLQLSLRNASNARLKYVWLYAIYDRTPEYGKRDDPFTKRFGDDFVLMAHEVPLHPSERKLVELGECGSPGSFVGIAVCRDTRSGCPDYDVVWSRTAIPEASLNPERLARD